MINHCSMCSRWIQASCLGLISLVGLAGCGANTATVSGKVTVDGKPLESGSVILFCQDDRIVRGIIGPEGQYTIPNVPSGRVTATVRSHPPTPPGFQLKQKLPPMQDGPRLFPPESARSDSAPIPERYGIVEESGLTFEVNRKEIHFNIELKP